MAALGGLRPQQAGPRTQALRQPARRDAAQALDMARDVYTRRQEGVSIWVVPSIAITASNPDDKGELFDPAADKIYRHPTFYEIPDEVGHM
jgi:ring-1,2-phenylacetyl-CoA epoxidase subunit PaaB